MKHILILAVAVLLAFHLCGCIAVSSREINQATRYEAAVTPDGTIYVVDKYKRVASPVREFREHPAESED
ncbi:MAG: hypothetical protein KKB50_17725 [Planctomycetes bacterium]|nr:hypothetical protein [Planctomycetota bacterium]